MTSIVESHETTWPRRLAEPSQSRDATIRRVIAPGKTSPPSHAWPLQSDDLEGE
jgi:hypothetical protein